MCVFAISKDIAEEVVCHSSNKVLYSIPPIRWLFLFGFLFVVQSINSLLLLLTRAATDTGPLFSLVPNSHLQYYTITSAKFTRSGREEKEIDDHRIYFFKCSHLSILKQKRRRDGEEKHKKRHEIGFSSAAYIVLRP